jgi:hypothetical protein
MPSRTDRFWSTEVSCGISPSRVVGRASSALPLTNRDRLPITLASRSGLPAGGSPNAMKKISITDAEAGQVVARPVATSSGLVMVQPGAELTPEIIARLTDLGVDTIWVEGVSEDAKPVEVLLAELDRRFTGHENDPLMMALKVVVADCISQGAASHRD